MESIVSFLAKESYIVSCHSLKAGHGVDNKKRSWGFWLLVFFFQEGGSKTEKRVKKKEGLEKRRERLVQDKPESPFCFLFHLILFCFNFLFDCDGDVTMFIFYYQ